MVVMQNQQRNKFVSKFIGKNDYSFPVNCGVSQLFFNADNWLYSDIGREREPVLICPALVATEISAMVTSSVSPERCEITEVYWPLAISTASKVSVRDPTGSLLPEWNALPTIPFFRKSTLVTNKSSPTNCTRLRWHRSVSSSQSNRSHHSHPQSNDGELVHQFFVEQPSIGITLGSITFSGNIFSFFLIKIRGCHIQSELNFVSPIYNPLFPQQEKPIRHIVGKIWANLISSPPRWRGPDPLALF